MGGARESFGSSGVIVLADDGRLAAQGTRHRRLARLEGIDHIHLKEGQSQHTVREQRKSKKTGQRNRLLQRLETVSRFNSSRQKEESKYSSDRNDDIILLQRSL